MATKLSEIFEQYYYGPEGDTLFCRPYPKKIRAHDDSFALLFKRNEQVDDRSLALVSAMISENYIDRILKLLLPTFTLDRPGAASRKISLLAAFNIIPKHLITAAGLVNQTRNEFAHNLNLTSFAELDHHKPEITKNMRSMCKSRKIVVRHTGNEIRALFDVMFQMATVGVIRFEENVRFYAEFTRAEPFIKAIEQIHSAEVQRHNDIMLEALRMHQGAPNRDDPSATV